MELMLCLLSGCIFFPACFIIVNAYLNYFITFKLDKDDIANISEKCVSSIQAICSCVVGIVIVMSCQDIIHDRHWLTNGYTCFGLPYFVYDTWAMYNSHYHHHREIQTWPNSQKMLHYMKHTKLLLLHHLFFPLIFSPVILYFRQGLGDFYIGVFYLIEITIPFISARQVMIQLKLTEYPSYKVVGLSMIAVFFISRILVFPFLYWSHSVYAKISFWKVFTNIPIKCNLGCLAVLLPQLYWLGLMIKGALKFFGKPKTTTLLQLKNK
ncbi:TLC domain-containing protein 3A [Patella vulgata]|uniref:TLC domain-containing protein 3A n=1 Tax=Patella vulgata TaxID=6465 RepID=UPI00217F98B8|nr:TLC domain-containing protein 3A [Patella vulgata]